MISILINQGLEPAKEPLDLPGGDRFPDDFMYELTDDEIDAETVPGNKEIKLEAEKKEKLLSISSIREYLKNHRAAMI